MNHLKSVKRHFKAALFMMLLMSNIFAQMEIRNVVFMDDQNQHITEGLPTISHITGSALNPENLLADLELLKEEMPQYSHVTVSLDPIESSNEVNLVFSFQRHRMVASLRIIIESHIKEPEKLRHELALHRGDAFEASILSKDIEKIEYIFHRKGYAKVKIESVLREDPDDDYLSHIEIHVTSETKQLKIYDVKIHGNSGLNDSTVREGLKNDTRGFFLASRPVFKVGHVEGDVERIKSKYENAGYLEVEVKGSWEIVDKYLVKVHFSIQENKRYELKEVRLEGLSVYSKDDLAEILNTITGHYSEQNLRITMQKIREFYGERGYPLAQVYMDYNPADAVVTFFINEGPLLSISKVSVEGLNKMKPETVLEDISFKEGDIINTKTLSEDMNKLQARGWFDTVRIDFKPDSEETTEVIISAVEGRSQVISFGVGGNANGGMMGEIGYSNSNILHSGNRFSISGSKNSELTKLGMMFADPHLFGSDWEFISTVSYKDEERNNYDDERIRAQILLERAINKNLKMGLGVRFEYVDIDNLAQELAQEDVDLNGKEHVVTLISKFSYKAQTYDTAGDVKEGISISMALLPGVRDDDVFARMMVNGRASVSLGENQSGAAHILSARIGIGYASKNTPFYDKNYAGGVGTLRGYRNKSLDGENNLGSEVLLSTTLEYAFPIYKNTIKGVTFLEAASVGNNFNQLSDFRAVGGFGLRANLKNTFLGNTLEAGLALPLNEQEGDQTKPFYFIFGDYDPAYDL
tara:strand:+ start:41173 stop:43431 length:2259 start_codon:yes stop_codon:yes gene_type:complete